MTEAMQRSTSSVTALLTEFSKGNRDLEPRLAELIYPELRRVAAAHMRRERGNHTLQPTALVNEAWVRLMEQPGHAWQNRAHFFGVASYLMRQILVDHARRRLAGKRGGARRQTTLSGHLEANGEDPVEVLALNELLEQLRSFDRRACRVVELHFFSGVSFEEIGRLLGISDRTAKRDWTMARAWLRAELCKER